MPTDHKPWASRALAAMLAAAAVTLAACNDDTAPATSYNNCDEVRAADKAPLKAGQPGFKSELDRDGDGVACDK